MRSTDKKSLYSRKQSKRDLLKHSETVVQSFTPEDLIKLGKQYAGLESPIDISFSILTEANLRPLEWINFGQSPKRMKISNSGTTAILSAKWHGPRPYLSKGPLTGYYVFSQLHFHWGANAEEGSEHTMNGKSLPLEVHVMFFKNTYLTQEDAMKQTDGTVTVAYLFTLQNSDNEEFDPIIAALKEIQKPLTSYHMELLPLEKFLHTFTDDYFMYWGNVVNRSILWLICRKPLGISSRQLSIFHNITGINEKPITKNFRGTKEINHRTVYHINPSSYRNDLLFEYERVSKASHSKKIRGSRSHINTSGVGTRNVAGDGKRKNDDLARDGSSDKGSEDLNDDSFIISVSVHKDKKLENTNSHSQVRIAEVSSVHSSGSNELAISLEKRRKSQIKFQLASALLNLEKEEGNDYAFLEQYLQTKFEMLNNEQIYQTPLSDEKKKEEAVLQPSARSLRMGFYKQFDISTVSVIKDKSKSDTNCFKNYTTLCTESDVTVGGSNKSGWSSMNVSENETRGVIRKDIPLPRPKTSSAKIDDKSRDVGGKGLLALRSLSKMSTEQKPLALRSLSTEQPQPAPRSQSIEHPKPAPRTPSTEHPSTAPKPLCTEQSPPAPRTLSPILPLPAPISPVHRTVVFRTPSTEKINPTKGILKDNSCKTPDSAVDEALPKIRTSLKQSLSKLGRLPGSSPCRKQRPDSRPRPAWRY